MARCIAKENGCLSPILEETNQQGIELSIVSPEPHSCMRVATIFVDRPSQVGVCNNVSQRHS